MSEQKKIFKNWRIFNIFKKNNRKCKPRILYQTKLTLKYKGHRPTDLLTHKNANIILMSYP